MPQRSSQSSSGSRTRTGLDQPKRYNAVLINDDFTTMDFVVDVLMSVFHKSLADAETIMLAVHQQGRGVAGTYCLDEAQTRAQMAMNMAREQNFPLKVICEPA